MNEPTHLDSAELAGFPAEWSMRQLDQLFSFKNGVNADKRAYGQGTPFVNVLETIICSHLHSQDIPGRVTLSDALSATYAVQRGDVLFNRTSETDADLALATVYVDEAAVVFGGFVIRGRPKTDELDTLYSGYALRARAVRAQIIPMGQGAVRANIGQTNLGRVVAPVPPIEEQRAIATALSDVDALITGLERLIAKKRDIKQAAMQQLLTGQTRLPEFGGEWSDRSLGSLGTTYGGLVGKSKIDFGHGSASYVPFVNVMANVRIDCHAFEPVDVATTENQNRVLSGDLLFNGSSETPEEVALCALMTQSVNDLYLNSFCFGFRLRQGAETSGLFLTYLIRSQVGRELMKSLAQGSTRYNLSKSALLQAQLKLPGLDEQTAIATVLSDMDTHLSTLEARLTKTRSIKQGMMQELLTGRTRLV